MSVAGTSAYVGYGLQTNFTTALAAGATDRRFGMEEKITSLQINENLISIGDLNTPLIQKFAYGRFEAKMGVEWVVSNPWFLDGIFTGVTSGVGPYTHTYDDSTTVNAFTAEVGVNTTTDRVPLLKRGTFQDLTITGSLDDVIRARANLLFGAASATTETSLDGSIPTDGITTPYTLVHATVENPSGTILAEVQNFEFTINPNIKHVYGLDTTAANAGFSVNAYKGRLDMSGKFTLTVVNNTWWNNVRARAEPSNNTLRFKFTNGDTSPATDERTIQFTFTGLGLGQLDMPIDPYELVVEDVSFTARDCTAIAINNTSAIP